MHCTHTYTIVNYALILLLLIIGALLLSTSILLFIMILAGNQLILGSFFGTSRDDQRNKTTPTLISHDAQEMVNKTTSQRHILLPNGGQAFKIIGKMGICIK